MNTKMKETTQRVLALLRERNPGSTRFYRKQINEIASELNLEGREYPHELCTAELKVHRGLYDLTRLIDPTAQSKEETVMQMSGSITSVVNTDAYVPEEDPCYIRWGYHADVVSIIRRGCFYPVFISGLSGNGKSVMIEQASAQLKREYIRVQISPETDEDDLIGGFRLIDGDTVFCRGPVIKAMERGCILLLDEIDRGTNKIMCLQGVLEGKPILIKKTGEVIRPKPGFNVFATANTKGRGSEDGRFSAASILDDAFLERFACTLEQDFPTPSIEQKIVMKHMEKYEKVDEAFGKLLTVWTDGIRKVFVQGGVSDLVSTRRLCHIVQTFAIFEDRMKAIEMCMNRFDTDTRTAMIDMYTKLDKSVNTPPSADAQPASNPSDTPKKDNTIPF